jgi:hypothetical protein
MYIITFPSEIFPLYPSMSEYFHPSIQHPDLPYWRPSPWLRYQAFKFLLENPSNTCVPSTTSVPTNPPELLEENLTGHIRKRKVCNEPDFHPKSHPYCHSCDLLRKVIKIEDSRRNFW